MMWFRRWIASLAVVGLGTGAFYPVEHVSAEPGDATDVFARAQQLYGCSPVDARMDPVWKAIPGLQGWRLNVTTSQEETAKEMDGHTHLVWNSVPPRVRLASLAPAPIYRAPGAEKAVALMVNVSWGEASLPSMLNTLHREDVKATFFLDGAWVKKHPGLAREIVKNGHAIGSHGTGHPDFRTLSDAKIREQMERTNAVLLKTLGRKPSAFAPPSGSFDPRSVKIASSFDMPTILWTVDTIDWRKPPATTIVRRVMARVEPGSLILMHPTEPTATALPTLIHQLRAKGYHFKTIPDVTAERRLPPPAVMP